MQNPDVATLATSQLEQVLHEGVCEVFSTMVGADLSPNCAHSGPVTQAHTTTLVGLAGPICGKLLIHCSEASSQRIAAAMLGLPEEEARDQRFDAIGEVCNMVAGNTKAKLGQQGKETQLSLPVVISGSSYRIGSPTLRRYVEAEFEYCGEPIAFRLEIHDPPSRPAATTRAQSAL